MDIWLQLGFDVQDGSVSYSCGLPGKCSRRQLIVLGKKRFVCMIWEDFYVLSRGRHVRYRHGAMMRLHHELFIGKFYIDGGRGSGFLEIVNRSHQWPGVGRTPTIDGPVIISRVQWRRK